MPDTNDNDIDALLAELRDQAANGYKTCQYAALTALVAERDELKERVEQLKQVNTTAVTIISERDALRKRVAELGTSVSRLAILNGQLLEQPPAASDLRERLVCAIWPVLIQQWREYKDAIDPRGCARSDALEEADKMIAAMRKGYTNA